MLFNRVVSIAIVTLSTLISAGGGDGETSEPQLKLTGPNQVKVFKSDNSIQCESEGIPLDETRLELAKAGIDVICAQKTHDGMGYPSVCGGGTGNINVYVIQNSNLPDAEKLGYKSVIELPGYKDQVCSN